MIVYKKTDKWYIEWQHVTMNGSEWQRMTMSGIANEKEWQQVVQRVTTIVVQRMTTSDNKWQRVTMNDNEWQRMTTSDTTNDNERHIERKQMKANESDFRFENETIMQCVTIQQRFFENIM